MNKDLDVYLKHYENLLILGDLNSELKEKRLNDFSLSTTLKPLTKNRPVLKNPNNPSCINRPSMVDNLKIDYDIDIQAKRFSLLRPCHAGDRNIQISGKYVKT